jgi:hypothetical protein
MRRKALMFAVLTEVILGLVLFWSHDRFHAINLAIRYLHAPAIGWYFGLSSVLGLSEHYDSLGEALVFLVQTLIWFGLYYALLNRKTKIRAA